MNRTLLVFFKTSTFFKFILIFAVLRSLTFIEPPVCSVHQDVLCVTEHQVDIVQQTSMDTLIFNSMKLRWRSRLNVQVWAANKLPSLRNVPGHPSRRSGAPSRPRRLPPRPGVAEELPPQRFVGTSVEPVQHMRLTCSEAPELLCRDEPGSTKNHCLWFSCYGRRSETNVLKTRGSGEQEQQIHDSLEKQFFHLTVFFFIPAKIKF